MEIKGKVHCFFEQSGTFKNEFIKLGIPAEDYDIQDNFGQTDHTDDLFKAIEDAYEGKPSLWDNITKDDLILAFFPCIYFCASSQIAMNWNNINYTKLNIRERTEAILERQKNREYFWTLAIKMLTVAQERGLRLIMENPWAEQTYLKANFVTAPSFIDKDRRRRGDYYNKPTAYWFINCEPGGGFTPYNNPIHKTQRQTAGSKQAGLCGEERSLMAPEYARNFICDFILGKEQVGTQLSIFDQ